MIDLPPTGCDLGFAFQELVKTRRGSALHHGRAAQRMNLRPNMNNRKSAARGSNFPGFAFHGADDRTFDCVYFRPFNFRAANPENASHAVQYISHPPWTWQKLRTEKAGQYETPLTPPLDGDAWFHARIVVAVRKVSVSVNDSAQPSLEVDLLHDRVGGRIAIWGGDAGDGGYFANLKITPREH